MKRKEKLIIITSALGIICLTTVTFFVLPLLKFHIISLFTLIALAGFIIIFINSKNKTKKCDVCHQDIYAFYSYCPVCGNKCIKSETIEEISGPEINMFDDKEWDDDITIDDDDERVFEAEKSLIEELLNDEY